MKGWFSNVTKKFLRVMWYVETIFREETYPFQDSNVSPSASRLIFYYISDEGCCRKIPNTLRISKASISGIIRRVSYAVATFVGSKLIRLPTTEVEVEELTGGYLGAHGFTQCIGAIDGTHVEIAEPSKHFLNFVYRKGYFSLIVQVVCDCKYCFQDTLKKWPGSVHGTRILLSSSINQRGNSYVCNMLWM